MLKSGSRIAVIMSGGSGRRFWPLSREDRPKQVVPIIDGRSLLELTIERLLPSFERGNIWVITKASQVKATEHLVRRHGLKVLSEPEGKNTAACIAYGATVARALAGDPAMVFLPADHFIGSSARFRSAVEAALGFVEEHDLVLTLGVRPTRPATGFGYIRRGERVGSAGRHRVFGVRRFTEKPALGRARKWARSGDYYWNSGIFLVRASVMLAEIGCYLPRVARPFAELEKHLGRRAESSHKRRCYRAVPEISIDFGVMERSRRVCVMPVDFGWDDLGSWDSYSRYMDRDANGNAVRGAHLGVDSKGCVVYSEKALVATVGVERVVVIVTDDAVLVAGKEAAEKVKDLTAMIRAKGFGRLL